MIGPRIGLKIGPRIGIAAGIGADPIAPAVAASSYPNTAAALRTAVGYGTWTSIWQLDETSPNALTDSIGGLNIPGSAASVYRFPGPFAGDYSVSSLTSAFALTTESAVTTGKDVVIAFVSETFAGPIEIKGTTTGDLAVYVVPAFGSTFFGLKDRTGGFNANITSGSLAGSWYVGLAAIDRGSNLARFCVCNSNGALDSGAVNASAFTDIPAGNGAFISVAQDGGAGGVGTAEVAYLALGIGAGYASGLVANMPAALASFYASIGKVIS